MFFLFEFSFEEVFDFELLGSHFLKPHSPIIFPSVVCTMCFAEIMASFKLLIPNASIVLLACCEVKPYPCDQSLTVLSRSNSVKGIFRCKQATANAVPPIPPPIIAT